MDAMGTWVCSCRAYGLLMTIDLYWLLLTCTFRLLEVGKLNLNTCSKLQARKGVDSENTCGASLTLMAGTKSVGTRNAMMAKGVTPTWKRSCIDWKHCPFCLLICSQAISCSCSTDQLTKSACFLNSSSSCLVCLHKTSSDQQWSEPIRPSDLIFRRCPARNPSGSVCKTEQYLHDIYMIFTWLLNIAGYVPCIQHEMAANASPAPHAEPASSGHSKLLKKLPQKPSL